MNLWKIVFVLCFVFGQINSFAQKPEHDLPQHSNDHLLHGEPQECLPQSLVQPANLHEFIGDNGVSLSWKAIPVTFGCQILGGPTDAEESFRIVEGYEATKSFFNYSQLLPNTNYKWKVRCACKTDPLTYGPYSEYQYFTTPNFELPYDPDQADLVVLFPNPTSGELNLHYNMDVSQDATMDIYSVRGTMVLSLPLKSGLNYIDTTDLEKGYYIVNINANNERKKLSFVKS